MTSIYDALGNLLYEIKKTPEIANLVARVCEYAVDEISKVNPKILNWDDWSKENTHTVKFLGSQFNQISLFLSDAHSLLDHTQKYHFKTVNQRLDFIIGKFRDWFVTYKDRKGYDRFYGLSEFKPVTIRNYPKIFKELKHLIDTGYINIDWLDKRRRKKLEKW